MLCSEPIQRKPQREAAEGRSPLWWRPKAATFLLALNEAHVLALNTAHVLRLNKADVLALNKAHVLRLNTKICPVFTVSTKEVAGKSTLPLFSSFSRILGRKFWSVARFQAFGNSPADPAFPAFAAQIVYKIAVLNYPATCAGGQDDVSSQANSFKTRHFCTAY